MFPDLPPLEADEAFLHAIGRVGGPCDCGDTADSPDSLGAEAAGWPIFGQFIAHDITADRSVLRSHVDVGTLRNARAPLLNLECLYGDGPVGHPFLFGRDDPAKFLLGIDGMDIPRNAEGIALIGDPRNDSHVLMSQMHLRMLKAHNVFVDEARTRGVPEREVFAAAARELRWHYQWAIIDEFLPSVVGHPLVDDLLMNGPRWFQPSADIFIPLEFAGAAFRYGHSQIRQRYQLNEAADSVTLFPDLLGFRAVPPDRVVDWTLLFECRRDNDRPTREADRRSAASIAHSAAGRHYRPVRCQGLRLARRTRSSAGPRRWIAVGRSGREPCADEAALAGRDRTCRDRVEGRDAALVLHPSRSGRDQVGKSARTDRRPDRCRSHRDTARPRCDIGPVRRSAAAAPTIVDRSARAR